MRRDARQGEENRRLQDCPEANRKSVRRRLTISVVDSVALVPGLFLVRSQSAKRCRNKRQLDFKFSELAQIYSADASAKNNPRIWHTIIIL